MEYLASFENFNLMLHANKRVEDLYIDVNIIGEVPFFENLFENSDT